MPRLEDKMAKVSEKAAEQLPDSALEVMQGHTKELQRRGLAEKAVGAGDAAPDFQLPATSGREVALADLRSRGPVILSFYRGRW